MPVSHTVFLNNSLFACQAYIFWSTCCFCMQVLKFLIHLFIFCVKEKHVDN
jgi:hypothetical protein